ncbi:MAG: undecaprenyl-diphosphate phosphatase [Thermodesulfobacteriota bacterium]
MSINLYQSIFLGAIQGLTEFLPISSSGHLVFFQSFFSLKEPPIFFDVLLHLGTLFAILLFFRKDIGSILKGIIGILKGKNDLKEEKQLLLWILLASVPTGLMGFLFKDWFESFFSKPRIVSVMFFATALFLWFTRWSKEKGRLLLKMKWTDALLIGIAQGIAIIPGISRSGATISTGILCGLDRELSGRFSFLISIPSIIGATLLEWKHIGWPSNNLIPFAGMVIASGTGILSLTFLMKVIKIGKISNFSYYCFGMGVIMLFLTL